MFNLISLASSNKDRVRNYKNEPIDGGMDLETCASCGRFVTNGNRGGELTTIEAVLELPCYHKAGRLTNSFKPKEARWDLLSHKNSAAEATLKRLTIPRGIASSFEAECSSMESFEAWSGQSEVLRYKASLCKACVASREEEGRRVPSRGGMIGHLADESNIDPGLNLPATNPNPNPNPKGGPTREEGTLIPPSRPIDHPSPSSTRSRCLSVPIVRFGHRR